MHPTKNKNMKKLFIIIQIVLLTYLLACSSSNKLGELWEGISGNTLRVIISEYIPHHEVSANNNDIQKPVKERLDQRGSLLMASYIVMNSDRSKTSLATDRLFNSLMDEAIKQGKVINIDCSENNYCRAIGEYNISEILKELK